MEQTGHAFELDDIHKESIVHAGSIAIPTLIAFSELNGKTSGKELLTGNDSRL
jgi:2-methylcitrate dehydratase PrpD